MTARLQHAAVLVFALLFSPSVQAQQPGAPASSVASVFPSSGTSADSPSRRRDLPSSSRDAASRLSSDGAADQQTGPSQALVTSDGAPLSASQILAILQQNPDASVELKSLLSDQAAQEGQPVQPDAITDEMLYRKISSAPEFRENVTTFLRARGYVGAGVDRGAAEPERNDRTLGGDRGFRLPGADEALAPRETSTSDEHADRMRVSSAGRRAEPREERVEEPAVLHRPAPYNLLSLRDLYSQVPEANAPLKRFGSEMFVRRDSPEAREPASSALDIPSGRAYVVGPGDVLAVAMWGGVSQNLTLTVNREGAITLPEAGVVQVGGFTLEQLQGRLTGALSRQYRDLQLAVTLSRARTVRVYVVGDVQRPGAYELSSLATPLNALYAAGGPTATGSLRVLRHYRASKLLGEIDLYDYLLRGVQAEERIAAGDTLLVPTVGPQVAVSGAVRRPAIYELKGASTLAAVLDDAGGASVTAELAHLVIERVRPNQERETVSLNLPSSSAPDAVRAAALTFAVRDGDKVRIAPIPPYSQRLVYLEGHVLRPGRMPYHDSMHLSDVLHSYADLLPEPADRGELVRLVAPDLHVETVEFDVPSVMIGNGNLALQPFDTIRVFGRYEVDAPKVTIGGEVLRPGSYSLSHGMTAAQLVRMAGGFKRDALLTDADLTSYKIVGGTRVVGERTSVRIGDAVSTSASSSDAVLKAGDVLTIHQITGWSDIGSSIKVEGEVAHPGSYGFQEGERLSSVLRRAGGFRETSYPAGAVLIRTDVQRLEEKSREGLIRQIETSSSAARNTPTIAAGDQTAQIQLIQAQQDQILARLRSEPPAGRLVIHITGEIGEWEGTSADVEVRAGDVLRIPKRPGFVLVSGQVYNSSAITFAPGKSAGWYLRRAGGATEVANTKEIFVIRANGSVVGREAGAWFNGGVLATRLDPGDVVVVPQKIIGASVFWRNLLTVAQITSSIAITAAVAGVL